MTFPCSLSRIALAAGLLAAPALARYVQDGFVIGTFWDPTLELADSARTRDLAKLTVLRECGFNLMTGANDSPLHPKENARKLDLVGEVPGLSSLVCDWRFWDAKVRAFDTAVANSVLREYGREGEGALTPAQRRAMKGYLLSDEPGLRDTTPGTREVQMENVIRWKDAFLRGDSTRLTLVNLFPYVPQKGFFQDTAEYKGYLDRYLGDPRVRVGVFDYYAFLKGGAWNRYNAEAPFYWRNLGWFADRVRRTGEGQAFWSFVMSSEHAWYDAVTAENLRLSAFAPLLYGAKGLLYFTYAQPRTHGRYDMDYRTYLADSAGRPFEPNYARVRAVNRRVVVLGPHLMPLQWRATVHGGTPDRNRKTATDPESGEPGLPSLASVGRLQDVLRASQPPLPGGCAVGILRDTATGDDVLLVLNKSRRTRNAFTLQINGDRKARRLLPDGAWAEVERRPLPALGATALVLPRSGKAELELIRIAKRP